MLVAKGKSTIPIEVSVGLCFCHFAASREFRYQQDEVFYFIKH